MTIPAATPAINSAPTVSNNNRFLLMMTTPPMNSDEYHGDSAEIEFSLEPHCLKTSSCFRISTRLAFRLDMLRKETLLRTLCLLALTSVLAAQTSAPTTVAA